MHVMERKLLSRLVTCILLLQAAITMGQSQVPNDSGKERLIITARALQDISQQPESDATEFFTEVSGSTTDETPGSPAANSTESPLTTSEDSPATNVTVAAVPIDSLDISPNDNATRTQPSVKVTEESPAKSPEDLSTSSSTILGVRTRPSAERTRSETSNEEHEVIYARLKHPVPTRPSAYGSRPFSNRFPFATSPPTAVAPSAPVPSSTHRPVFPSVGRPGIEDPIGFPEDILPWGKPNRWDKDKGSASKMNMTRIQSINAECQNDFMKIRIKFNGSFSGLIYSTGYAYDPLCVYINGTGRDYYEFYIQLNRCGTLGGDNHNLDSRKQPTNSFMWNTLTIQYSPLIEEEWDEHYKVTCEYGYDYWKTISFPFLDVEVATGNPLVFTLTPPECHMEIRSGYGTTGTRVTGPVRVGDPLTLIVYMRSQYDGFDVIVSDCYAHNGGTKKIPLIDANGCPVNEKLISRFRGTWSDSGLFETQVFAYMKAFRFTGSPALYVECDVRMCHGHCPTQPCYWRNAKEISKRDVSDPKASRNATFSENLNLFQAIQVIGDDDIPATASRTEEVRDLTKSPSNTTEDICLKPSALGTILGFAVLMYLILGILSCALCIRLRRSRRCDSSSDLFRNFNPGTQNSSYGKQYY